MKDIINRYLNNKIKDKNSVAILFSGGLDSLSIMLSCMEIGINPVLYTFYLDGFISNDIVSSRKIADDFNLKLVEVVIPYDVDILIKDIYYIIKNFNVYKKTAVQCIHPFIYIERQLQEKYILSGLCADDLYGTSKHLALMANNGKLFDEERMKKVKDETSSAYKFIKQIFKDKEFIAPYKDCQLLIKYFLDKSFSQMNKPKQKYIMFKSYQEYIDKFNLYRRNENLQCSSKIREYHDLLLNTELNVNNNKIVTPIYRRIYDEIQNNKY